MAQALADITRYESDYRTFEERLAAGGSSPVRDLREHALARFRELGFPTARKGNERWKYTNVGPIAAATFAYPFQPPAQEVKAADFHGLLPWDEGWGRLVFVDGWYSEALSSLPPEAAGVRAGNLADALGGDGDAAGAHLARHASVEDDGFIALNTAFLHHGAYVHVPDDRELDVPLHLVFLSTDRGEPSVSYPRTLVVTGRNTRLTLVESYVGLSDRRYFTDAVAEIVLGEGARVEHYRYLREGGNAFHIGTTRVHQGRDSEFSSIAFAFGCAIARNDMHVQLAEPGASCTLNGLYMTSGTQHIDNSINVDHVQPHCTSHQYWKGILAGKSRAVYSGQVVVHPGAQKTNASQADKNLILSRDAEVDTKPSLLIYADDVQCTHGATAGHIDEDAVFYLRSRGLDIETASRLLINGFAREIIDTIALEPVRTYLDDLTASSLPDFKFEFA